MYSVKWWLDNVSKRYAKNGLFATGNNYLGIFSVNGNKLYP